MVVKAIAAETWGCFHSDDGRDGSRNEVGRLLFSDKRTATAKTTRSAKTGQIKVPLRGGDTFITNAAHVWNRSATLRRSTTKAKVKKGGIRLGGSLTALVLRDVTPRLRLVGCSLRVVGRLLRDVGLIPGDVDKVRREVWHVIFCTVSDGLFTSFSLLPALLPRGMSRISFSSLAYGGEE
jgi:hypothetical protein